MVHYYSYLALGDSYTIGESVAIHESFPYQTVQLLRKQKKHFHAPEIIAKTGWTSSELAEHILHTELSAQYDFVTLLIGVNNQYRGLQVDNFMNNFEFLLKKSIHLTGGNNKRVIVLSIPDWGFTPYGANKDGAKISREIDAYNVECARFAKKYGAHFVNITEETRAEKNNLQALASDELHYSGKTHLRWAEKVAATIKGELEN